MKILLILTTFLLNLNTTFQVQKEYVRTYFDDGTIQSEGWISASKKTGYWKFYNSNGKITSEGHYLNNLREKYWYFYNQNGQLISEGHYSNDLKKDWWIFYQNNKLSHKAQYQNNLLNGFCICYQKKKIYKVEKFIDNKKVNEWKDAESFKKDNDLSKLL